MTVFAIGAAVWPPTPCWFSRKTAIATRGASAGAKAMNEVVFTPGAPVSAVPVLPATATPGICAAVPVPPVTTDSIIVVSSFAVSRRDRPRAGPSACARTIVEPSGRGDLVDDVGLHDDAVVGDPGRDHRHLQRRHLQPLLAEREPPGVDLVRVVAAGTARPLL